MKAKSSAEKGGYRAALCSHISSSVSALFHRAERPVSEEERSGSELHCGAKKPVSEEERSGSELHCGAERAGGTTWQRGKGGYGAWCMVRSKGWYSMGWIRA